MLLKQDEKTKILLINFYLTDLHAAPYIFIFFTSPDDDEDETDLELCFFFNFYFTAS